LHFRQEEHSPIIGTSTVVFSNGPSFVESLRCNTTYIGLCTGTAIALAGVIFNEEAFFVKLDIALELKPDIETILKVQGTSTSQDVHHDVRRTIMRQLLTN
jgi:hypothetical protein